MLIAALLGGAFPAGAQAQDSYLFYVASESDDVVTLVRFTPGAGLSAEKVISVGWLPAEIEAPHGVFVDPTGFAASGTGGRGDWSGTDYDAGDAWDHVAALTVGQDVSDRALQFAAGMQFSLGKSFDTYGPTGPAVVSIDQLANPDSARQ